MYSYGKDNYIFSLYTDRINLNTFYSNQRVLFYFQLAGYPASRVRGGGGREGERREGRGGRWSEGRGRGMEGRRENFITINALSWSAKPASPSVGSMQFHCWHVSSPFCDVIERRACETFKTTANIT